MSERLCLIAHTHTHTHTHIYIYIYIYRERERSTRGVIVSDIGNIHGDQSSNPEGDTRLILSGF